MTRRNTTTADDIRVHGRWFRRCYRCGPGLPCEPDLYQPLDTDHFLRDPEDPLGYGRTCHDCRAGRRAADKEPRFSR